MQTITWMHFQTSLMLTETNNNKAAFGNYKID
jgi:hypothetical protein